MSEGENLHTKRTTMCSSERYQVPAVRARANSKAVFGRFDVGIEGLAAANPERGSSVIPNWRKNLTRRGSTVHARTSEDSSTSRVASRCATAPHKSAAPVTATEREARGYLSMGEHTRRVQPPTSCRRKPSRGRSKGHERGKACASTDGCDAGQVLVGPFLAV